MDASLGLREEEKKIEEQIGESEYKEIEKKLFESIQRLNTEALVKIRNNGLYDTSTIQAVVGLLMLLGVKEDECTNEDVYLRFMRNPET